MSDLKHAMHRVLDGMGKAAHAARARRFAKRATPAEAPDVGLRVTNDAPSPAHDMVDLAMTPEEMEELQGTMGPAGSREW